jgi:uncharacterized membrane protein
MSVANDMKRFSMSIDIAAPTERVAAVMIDVEKWHEWTASITSVKLLDDAPMAVGSRALVHQPKLPPAFWTVSVLEPARGFTWFSAGPGMRATGHHYAESTPTGSRATLTLEYDGVLAGLLAWLTKSVTEKYLAFEAEGLKARSEASGV